MKYKFKPTTGLEKFATKVYNLLVENFSQTFFVGGMVRDLLLNKSITDVDVATQGKPEEVEKALQKANISHESLHKKFGTIVAKEGKLFIEITTLRTDLKGDGRFPKVKFIKIPKQDSVRRDFTINSLYLSPKSNEILDFQNGLADLKNRKIKFIGIPKQRIIQDPLRIIRALRFALVLNFKLEAKTKLAIKNNFNLVESLSKIRLKKEILKLKNKNQQNILKIVINKPKLLDNYFKTS